MKKLPQAEFELMQAVWEEAPPVATHRLMARLMDKQWKQQTALTLLSRLEARGFVRSERKGREKLFTPLIAREDYLAFESAEFVKNFHGNSVTSLVSALHQGGQLSDADARELAEWLRERG